MSRNSLSKVTAVVLLGLGTALPPERLDAKSIGRSAPNTAPAAAAAAAQAAQQEAAQAGQRAKDALTRSLNQIQAVGASNQAARDAARAALKALPSGIPAGLQPGGLDPIQSSDTWIGGGDPQESKDGDRTKVEIDQTQQRAIFTWKTFNVSEDTDVKFDQQGNANWIALNRILDPNMAPSRILGSITADGVVLVINQNGIVFGAGSQINVGGLYASTLEVGPAYLPDPTSTTGNGTAATIALRNQNFLANGILGYTTTAQGSGGLGIDKIAAFSALDGSNNGTITVENGAEIATTDGGLILLAAPHVINGGHLVAPQGQVILAAAETALGLTASGGDSDQIFSVEGADAPIYREAAPNDNVRGLVPLPQGKEDRSDYYVWNQSTGLIEAPEGNIYLRAPGNALDPQMYDNGGGVTLGFGAAYNDGILSATTSVSRNGSVMIDGGDVRLGKDSLISILADASETIEQGEAASFKPSDIEIGRNAQRIDMDEGSLLLAPSANVAFGRVEQTSGATQPQSINIANGAEINVAGLTDVVVPISAMQIVIDKAKQNELADSPLYRLGFLNGATIYLDPRNSGVRDDGIAWIGSPLLYAKDYYAAVAVGADQLMTKGGTVALGGSSSVVVNSGATIDMSGGWVRYQGGLVHSTQLVDQYGHIVDIANADPNATYVALAGGFTRASARWNIVETWANPFMKADRYVPEYIEGRDAGALRIYGSALAFDGTLIGNAYAGPQQIADGKAGTGSSGIEADERLVQGANSELPAGGALVIASGSDVLIEDNVTPLADGSSGDWTGGGIGADGVYTPPTRNPNSALSADRDGSILLSDDLLSNSGLSQVTIYGGKYTDVGGHTNDSAVGNVTVGQDANVTLQPGGVFHVEGKHVEVDGNITVPSGRILLKTIAPVLFAGQSVNPGDFDVVVNGNLNVAGRWVNDYEVAGDALSGPAWLSGGSIAMDAASSVLAIDGKLALSNEAGLGPPNNVTDGNPPSDPPPGSWINETAEDVSGSILVNSAAKLNLSGGGRIDAKGNLDLTAKGGNLSLASSTAYYKTDAGEGSGFRVVWYQVGDSNIIVNPDKINARIQFDPSSIEAHGFGGGGTFALETPEFSLGDGSADVGTRLPIDFFSTAGFGTYNITSTKTELSASPFGYGGTDAYTAVQTITVGAGQTLSLVQSVLPSILDAQQAAGLRGLATGGDVNSVVSAILPPDAYDQQAVNLKLGGMLELHVAEGGQVLGAAGSTLTVGGLLNEGTIRIPGGTILQDQGVFITGLNDLNPAGNSRDALGFRDLSDIFTINPDGSIDPKALSKLTDVNGNPIRNQDVVGDNYSTGSSNPATGRALFKLGLLDQDQGILLTPGSVTDLSGAVLVNPRAVGVNGRSITDGRIVGGGVLGTVAKTEIDGTYHAGGSFTAEAGALVDLSGVAGTFDRLTADGYAPTAVWSDGGTLLISGGGTLAGAVINAHGGNAEAEGGTLDFANPVFAQHDVDGAANIVSADMIAAAGFDTLVARASMTSLGDADLKLGRAFFLLPEAYKYSLLASVQNPQDFITPVISTGGALEIDAPYIGLQNVADSASPATGGTAGNGSVTLKGRQIDVTGAVRFDQSVSNAILSASGDIRFIGVDPTSIDTFRGVTPAAVNDPTLKGMLAVNGNLTLTAGQIYPTTGTSFDITSAAADGSITIGRSGTTTPSIPYSAGGDLAIQAAHIWQGGVIRVPFGTLTLGSNSAQTSASNVVIAPATQSVVLADGSITSVSAGGLSIPYGTTTDTIEWYFSPTQLDQLSGPPQKVLSLNGRDISIAAGATVDLTGGGDVYAYEFIHGTGGTRDVLSRFNSDAYSANIIDGVGYQYPDARQVYAIVPGLSNAPAAAYDPIYSADYAGLSSVSGVGQRVYLAGGNGLSAGWYTLLPAQYAMLPGGMRVVEQTGVTNAVPGASAKLADGSLLVSGYYGDALSGSSQSTVRQFSVMSQDVIKSYSNIVLTSGNDLAYSQAASKGLVAPRTGLDAGRLVLNPLQSLAIDTTIAGSAATGGRGSQVDIAGTNMEIVSAAGTAAPGVVQLSVDSLNRLNAESLLIGATRTDNTDGTTDLTVTANTIVVANDADHPLVAPEIVLAVDDMAFDADGNVSPVASSLVLNDGATITATGVLNDQRSGAYVIDGRVIQTTDGTTTTYHEPINTAIGALFRVANGPQRLVQRLRSEADPTLPGNIGSPTGPDALLNAGNINVSGAAIGFDTSNNISIGSNSKLAGTDIALGATHLAFTNRDLGSGTVVITPELQAILAQGEQLTLRSQTSIDFDDGTYTFNAIAFDAAALKSLQGGDVSLNATTLQFGNAGAATNAVAGSGHLTAVADEIVVGDGTLTTSGFGGTVNLTARNGLFSAGKSGGLDVGSADLSIVTPYMGDRGTPGVFTDASTGMSFTTSGDVTISAAGTTPIDLSKLPGIPGSSLTIAGNNVSVSGTRLRATAGALSVKAAAAIALSGGAILEAPGYEQTFGDAADPQVKAAPGGTLLLAALGQGGLSLGDAHLSVGNGTGDAGTLQLSAPNGPIGWGTATFDGHGGEGDVGGTFSIDTQGAIDLVTLNNSVGANGFTGGFAARTRSGDIVLAAGQTLSSGSVNLTADGGSVIIGGAIDTSGVNGGDIALYGAGGVTINGTALLDAHANGYASDDTRQAHAGDVTLGTDFIPGSASVANDGSVSGDSGAIAVAAGASIDVSAHRPGDRLVRIVRDGVVNYAYVQGDEGGTVTLRGPVVANEVGRNIVNISVATAQSIIGAQAVDLVGFKRWDLEQVANSGLYKGVTYDPGTDTVSLDVAKDLDTANADGSMTSVGGLNFLGDNGAGTVVDFVQNFDVSAGYASLGGLAEQDNFHAQPGLDLAATGNITLASNWNLGAGTVNLARAAALGYATRYSELEVAGVDTSGYVIKSGSESNVFGELTKLTYRTNHGDVRGEAPVVALRAGGNLDLNGSLTDGFFMFRDQTDETYRKIYGSGTTTWANYLLSLNGGFNTGNGRSALTDWASWNGSAAPGVYLGLSVASRSSIYLNQSQVPAIPYTAVGNSPAARGTFVADALGNVDGGGDPVGSAEVFPLLPDGSAVPSSSYSLVAGAAGLANGSVKGISADPARINAGSSASIAVTGMSTYQVPSGSSTGVVVDGLGVDNDSAYSSTARPGTTSTPLTLADWLAYITGPTFTGENDNSVAVLNIGRSTVADDDPNRALVLQLFAAFASEHSLEFGSTDPNKGWRYNSPSATSADATFIAMSVKTFKLFVTEKLIPAMTTIESNILAADQRTTASVPTPTSFSHSLGAKTIVRPLIRTGTGSIQMVAAGDVDLTGGPLTYVDQNGQITSSTPADCNSGQACVAQLGGIAVYTVGHRAAPFSETLSDPLTGAAVTIATPASQPSNFGLATKFSYSATGNVGILIADPLYLTDGGDISVTAQGSVLSRRDLSTAIENGASTASWVGLIDTNLTSSTESGRAGQPWRISSTNMSGQPTATINPELFREGIGALGGGDVSIEAGDTVSDLTTVVETSLATSTATTPGTDATNVLLTWGGGDVAIRAAGDILANRVDVASGSLLMTAGGDIGNAASMLTGTESARYLDLDGTLWTPTLPAYTDNETRVRIDDAVVDLAAGGDLEIAGIKQLDGFYSDKSALNLTATGSVTVTNTMQISSTDSQGAGTYAIYPGSLTVAALTGDVDLRTAMTTPAGAVSSSDVPLAILMAPSPDGELRILAGGDIAPTKLAMLDIDPNFLPGLFTLGGGLVLKGPCSGCVAEPGNGAYQWGTVGFPSVTSAMSDTQRKRQHASTPTHLGDPDPVYIYAGRDIGSTELGVNLSLPKQARIYAGRDILNMMFSGQNLAESDITRIAAGRDIIGTVSLVPGRSFDPATGHFVTTPVNPTLNGNTFILGGPGELMLEAGRNMGPFLNSAEIYDPTNFSNPSVLTYAGGVVTVGNEWNPYLKPESANITVQFGVANGADYAALRDAYVAPGTDANALGDYGTKLVAWMQEQAADTLEAEYGTTGDVSAAEAYVAFLTLPELRQRIFLTDVVYFDELRAPAVEDGPSYLKYSRGYQAVNTLFPASLGYTANDLEGGAKSGAIVHTGDMDLRLATIETLYGGNIDILGPGGRVLAGSVVATSQQAARRNYAGYNLYSPPTLPSFNVNGILSIPLGYEGVLTQRGGDINTFTDGDFVLNQSRLFTVGGGDVTMWSSNADLNAGQGAKTTANFPPVNVRIDEDLISTDDRTSATTGAGIAAFAPADPKKRRPNVYLLAPRGTVDAGDAGVRVAGNLSVAALQVANADNFQVSGVSVGIPTFTAPDSGALTSASNTAAAVSDQAGPDKNSANAQPSVIIVEILGFGGGDGASNETDDKKKDRKK